ncbi:MAG TPA: response regulator transcription factor [Solirubrobacteraceae bacterium]|jgi:DNA-binding NarL/FixJ family response regulator|nr:response regulator transcription factor [Solirubrobacteraceae bacterium]
MLAGENAAPIRVVIIDDHDLFRIGLAMHLRADSDVEVIGQASGGHQGVKLALELLPDVVLTDLRMPELDGIGVIRAILAEQPEMRIVALTVATDDRDITAALNVGACAFLAKDSPVAEIVAALKAAAAGSAWLSPRAAESVLGRLRYSHPEIESTSDSSRLSARELEVLRLIARGLENSEIAETLDISASTAKNHVSSVLTKLGLPNRVQAAIYAIRRDLG